MSASQIARFTSICEDQGIRVTRTKKGLFLRFPDGSSTVQHFTNSDIRANQNQIARFRRAGVVHPDDKSQDLPPYITSGGISQKTRQRVIDYIVKKDFPVFVYANDLVTGIPMEAASVNRALYHSGFKAGPKPSNSRKARQWFTPDHIMELKTNYAAEGYLPEDTPESSLKFVDVLPDEKHDALTPEVLARRAREAQEAINALGAGRPEAYKPTPEQVIDAHDVANDEDRYPEPPLVHDPVFDESALAEPVEQVDFIDERESWVIDPADLFGSKWETFMKDELRVLKALGIRYEIRVWKEQS